MSEDFREWLETELAVAIFGEALSAMRPNIPQHQKNRDVSKARTEVDLLQKVLDKYNEVLRRPIPAPAPGDDQERA